MHSYPENIFAAIRHDRDDFLYNYIEIVDGLLFNQYQNIKRIHKYYNSHYESGDYETINGVQRKKVFYNINKWRADVATKMIDIDVKDFLLISENYDTDFQVYLLEKEMKAWLKKHKLGKVLNEVVRKLPVYGSVVLRKLQDGAEVVDLRMLMNDQGANTLKEGRYTILKHLMTASDMRKMKGTWDNVDEAIQKFCTYNAESYEDLYSLNRPASSPYVEVYERFAEVPLSWITDKESDSEKWILGRFIVAGIDQYQLGKDGEAIGEDGVILFREKIKELPFKEVHYQKTEGRWLGIGVVEDTFEAQVQINRVKDAESKAMELASLILFQSRDELASRNLLSDVENGEILRVKSEITRIDNKINNTGEFKTVADSYEQLADRSTFSYDIVRGEAPPASSTLGSVQIQAEQAASIFDYKRENVGLFLQEFITDLVFPELESQINTSHVLRFTGSKDELEKMRRKAAEMYCRKLALESGEIPTAEEKEMQVEKILQQFRTLGDKIWIDIRKDFFQNLEYEVTLEVTGETKNVQAMLNNISAVLTELARNPALIQNPLLKRLLFKQMSLMGMSVSELEMADAELTQQTPEQLAQQQQLTEARNLGGAAGQNPMPMPNMSPMPA